jgi:hypothetical protein
MTGSSLPRRALAPSLLFPALVLALVGISGCSSGSSSPTSTGGTGGTGGTGSTGSNVAAVAINAGPANEGVDLLYASVTV